MTLHPDAVAALAAITEGTADPSRQAILTQEFWDGFVRRLAGERLQELGTVVTDLNAAVLRVSTEMAVLGCYIELAKIKRASRELPYLRDVDRSFQLLAEDIVGTMPMKPVPPA